MEAETADVSKLHYKTRKKKPSPNMLQARLADAVIEEAKKPKPEFTRQELMEKVGYSSVTADKQSARVWSSDGFQRALAARGCTPDKISKVFEEAAAANVVVVSKGEAYETDVADHKIRMQAADKMAELSGAKKLIIETHNINVNVDGADIAKMLGIIDI